MIKERKGSLKKCYLHLKKELLLSLTKIRNWSLCSCTTHQTLTAARLWSSGCSSPSSVSASTSWQRLIFCNYKRWKSSHFYLLYLNSIFPYLSKYWPFPWSPQAPGCPPCARPVLGPRCTPAVTPASRSRGPAARWSNKLWVFEE